MTPLEAGLTGTVSAAMASPLIIQLLRRLKSQQIISEHIPEHQAKAGTPTMGGLIVLLAVLVSAVANWSGRDTGLLLLVLAYGLIGFVDDFVVPRLLAGKRGLGWKQKLLLQVLMTYGILSLHGGSTLSIATGTFLVLMMSNAYNFSDGIDGLAGTLGVFLFGFFLVAQPLQSSTIALVGGLLVFLAWNWFPAKVFMGDVGALPIGAALGYRIWEASSGGWTLPTITGLSVLSLVMLIELVPVPIQILSVKLFGKRVFPKTPIHHAFQVAGWSELKIVSLFGGLQLACSVAAYFLLRGGSA